MQELSELLHGLNKELPTGSTLIFLSGFFLFLSRPLSLALTEGSLIHSRLLPQDGKVVFLELSSLYAAGDTR